MNKNKNQLRLNCAILILDFNEWTHRNGYIRIIEGFFNNRINFEEFDKEFIWSTNNNKDKSWEELLFIINNFKLNEFDDFLLLTSKLFEDMDIVENDPLFRQNYQISEEQN